MKTETENTTVKKVRGRKPMNFSIPQTPFTVKMIHTRLTNLKRPMTKVNVNVRLMKLVKKGEIKIIDVRKEGKQGRPANVFAPANYVPKEKKTKEKKVNGGGVDTNNKESLNPIVDALNSPELEAAE